MISDYTSLFKSLRLQKQALNHPLVLDSLISYEPYGFDINLLWNLVFLLPQEKHKVSNLSLWQVHVCYVS